MINAISVLPDLCTGCQSCEMVCSLSHEGASCPSLSRIQVKKWGEIAVFMPIVCQHCTDAPCVTICPTRARKRIPETQAVVTDPLWCVGCKSCIYACPFGAPVIHPVSRKTMTCDLCDGKPLCVDACTVGALSLTSDGKISFERKKLFAQKVVQTFRRGG
jgi:anaerobic carbon-monoxide dehydrogenase iron sulfur subunit